MLGVLAGLTGFMLILFKPPQINLKTVNTFQQLSRYITKTIIQSSLVKPVSIVLLTFLLINLIYGSALTRFQLSNLLPKQPTGQASRIQSQPTGITQLENGGTESGQIRLIVWRGALDIFKHYPLFGSGVETFAYSYYQFRPAGHNLVSEWDFLYNKAHNEFLNYLSTTGIIGFGTYLAIIITFIFWLVKKLVTKDSRLKHDLDSLILLASLLAGYLCYLVQNFFSFSVVMIALLFYLFPAFAFVLSDSIRLQQNFSINWVYKRSIYTKTAKVVVFLTTCYLLLTITKMWLADSSFSVGERANETGNAGRAYNFLAESIVLNPREPFYRNEFGFAAAASAVSLKETDATLSAQLKNDAVGETEKSLRISPKNTSLWRTAIRTYYMLSELDKSFTQKAVDTIDQTIFLAPTDPKLYYNKAIILGQMDRNLEAISSLQKAVELKPNYKESYYSLALFYFDQKEYPKAIDSMSKVLKLVPNDPEALKKLNDWGQQGIATQSAKP